MGHGDKSKGRHVGAKSKVEACRGRNERMGNEAETIRWSGGVHPPAHTHRRHPSKSDPA
jgi:hypothetical protein